MPRRVNKRRRTNKEALRLLAEAQECYHRLHSHAGDAFECMVCRSKDFRGYITRAEWANGPIVDVARMYRELLGA